MKLIRSNREWLERRRQTKIRKINTMVNSSQWWDKSSSRTKPVVSTKSNTSSTKRTQIGKKV